MRFLTAALLFCCGTSLSAEQKLVLDWRRLESLPNREGVAAPCAGVSGGALIVAGGANFPERKPWEGGRKVWHDDVLVLENPTAPWKHAGRLPRALAYAVSSSWRDEIICVGGSDAERHYADVFALRWRDGRLGRRTLPSLPVPVANACGGILDDTLYILGGVAEPNATHALTNVFALKLDAREPTWRELPSWPGAARMLAMAAIHESALYLVGGVELLPNTNGSPARRYLKDTFRYEPRTGWRNIADLPFPVAAAPSIAPQTVDGFLILGGDDGSRAALSPSPNHPGFNTQILLYSAVEDSWKGVGSTPAPRVTVPAVLWQGGWVIPSGEIRPGVRSPDVWHMTVRARATSEK